MEAIFFHPKLVHLPIALAVLMPLLSAGLLVAWFRDLLPRRTWIIAVALQAVLVLSSIAAMRSGEADEERVERVVAESAIEAHEEAAELFTWVSGGVLLLFVAGAAIPAAGVARAAACAAVAGSLVVLFLGYRVGEAGGELVYKHGAASAYTSGAAAAGAEMSALAGNDAAQDDDDD